MPSPRSGSSIRPGWAMPSAAGFLKGLALGHQLPTCAQMGSVAATYALEHLGGQGHAYTWEEFHRRYTQSY